MSAAAPLPSPQPPRPSARTWVVGARPRTLPAAISPVLVGAASAAGGSGVQVVWWRVGAAFAVSLLLQIGVNYANDYSDGVKGTDAVRVGPIRLVGSGLASASSVKRAAMLALGLAALIGLVLAVATSWWLIVVGACAIASAWFYTGGRRPYGYLGLGEAFVFVFFGLVATAGTAYVAGETIPAVTWPVACGVGALITAVLVVNNLRDIPTDRTSNKNTLAVRMGDRGTRYFFVALVVAAMAACALAALSRPWVLLGVGSMAVAQRPLRVITSGATGHDLIPVLGSTGKLHLVYAVLVAIGLAL